MRDYNYTVNKKKYLIQKEIYENSFLKEADDKSDPQLNAMNKMKFTQENKEDMIKSFNELKDLKNKYPQLMNEPKSSEASVKFFENLKKAGIDFQDIDQKSFEDLFSKYKENKEITPKDIKKAFGDGAKKVLGDLGGALKSVGKSFASGFKN